ncbi:hypothetical protein L2E82_12877 [Cichorium intybus]|uniref:Uncharacterized protein n=1 Tax=Cichorium intybus TaxID=13427 RepID=A0ACB9GHA9_CICIN|nr:hypothetical protein L2E82_12877 [Cichorium intybus]
MGAKNHGIVMRDANIDATLNVLVADGFRAAGQRCMALSIVVLVGDATKWENELVKRAKQLKVNAGIEPDDADLGPAKERVCRFVQSGVENGAKLLLRIPHNCTGEVLRIVRPDSKRYIFLAQGGTAVGTGLNTKKGFDVKIAAAVADEKFRL